MIELSVIATNRHCVLPAVPGRCLSVYRHAINLLWPSGDLLTLHRRGSGMSPMGMVLRQDDFDWLAGCIAPGEPVCAVSACILQLGGCRLALDRGRCLSMELPHHDVAGTRACGLSAWLQAQVQPAGLGLPAATLLAGAPGLLGQHVQGLALALRSDRCPPVESVQFLLGRGEGVTPAGDDMLVGMLAVLALNGRSPAPLAQVLSPLLDGPLLTTPVSRAYLLHALAGRFSSSLVRLLRRMAGGRAGVNDFTRFSRHGHTSGMDTLCGMALLERMG